MSTKKDTYTSGPAHPRQPRTASIEAALHLASTARRYTQDKVNVADVERAIEIWHESMQPGSKK